MSDPTFRQPFPKLSGVPGALGWILGALVIVFLASDSYFIVQPTEMAGVRRLGTVHSTEPVPPGLHFKAPFIDTVDKLQVSIDNHRIDKLNVYTIDNQSVQISVGITYHIPKDAVLKLLYQVGKPGDAGIMHNIEQIISDRTLKVFAKRNTIKISEEREQISNEVRHAVAQGVREQFGMEILDLQIPSIKYSDTFVASVEAAVKAKNDSVAAENTVNRIRYEGEQKVVTAKAEAEAAVARAQAQRQARILEAEGDARGIELRAVAEAQSIRIRGEALKDNARVIELTIAQRWNGQPPQTVLGGAGAAVPFFNIGTAAPASAPAQQSAQH
jgi:regulator of protease activity HflC (stomatin/prohibitin superfamily)